MLKTPRLKKFIKRRILKLNNIAQMLHWYKSGFSSPAPWSVKMRILKKYGLDRFWIESGTFLGTTAKYISKHCFKLYTIEPQKELYNNACQELSRISNIELIEAKSEDVLESIVQSIISIERSPDITFWLDGHFSQGNTFKGAVDTPVLQELQIIERLLPQLGKVVVLVDDMRLFAKFNYVTEEYPPINSIVSWSESCGLKWIIEHDIFIARNF